MTFYKKTFLSFLLSLAALIIMGCSGGGGNPTDALFGEGGVPVLVPVPTPTDVQLLFTSPSASGSPAGWQVYVEGNCQPIGGIVNYIVGGVASTSVCLGSGNFESNIDVSHMPIGNITISAFLSTATGDLSTTETVEFNKTNTACDSAIDRADTYANFSTGGDGGATPWIICTPEQFQNVNLNRTHNFLVQNDINYDNSIHIPFSAYFEGDFDGANFTVRKALMASAGDNVGLFSQVRAPANIHDLNLDSFIVSGRNRVAGLIGWVREQTPLFVNISNITASNMKIKGSSQTAGIIARLGYDNNVVRPTFSTVNQLQLSNSSISGSSYVAGIIGYAADTLGSYTGGNYTVENSAITGSGSYIGSIIGRMNETTAILTDFTSTGGSVEVGTHYGAGLVGEFNQGSLTNFNSTTDVTANGTGRSYFGGLIGLTRAGGTLNGTCSYTGTVAGNDNSYVGGAIGYLDDGISLSGCTIDATVNGRDQIGGVVGRTDPNAVVQNIDAAPTIAKSVVGERYTGGLIGYANTSTTLQNSVVNSSVTSNNIYAGGAIGYHRANLNVDSVFSSGNVTATNNYAGGLLGGSGNNNAVLINSGASGDVSGLQFVGGLVGRIRVNGVNDFANNFCSGNVRGSQDTGGIIGYIHRNVAGIANRMYTSGTVTRIIGATGAASSFGAIAGRANAANAFTNTSLFYDASKSVIDESINLPLVGQNAYGTGVLESALRDTTTYTTLPADYTFPNWVMPALGYTLPGTNTNYPYPVLDWM